MSLLITSLMLKRCRPLQRVPSTGSLHASVILMIVPFISIETPILDIPLHVAIQMSSPYIILNVEKPILDYHL